MDIYICIYIHIYIYTHIYIFLSFSANLEAKINISILLAVIFFLNFFYLLIYFWLCWVLAFCARAFSSCGKRGPHFIAVRGLPTAAAPPVAEHRLQTRRLSSCGSRAQLLRGMWDPPGPGPEPVSPALAGRLSTTVPPWKPIINFYHTLYVRKFLRNSKVTQYFYRFLEHETLACFNYSLNSALSCYYCLF